MSRIERLWPRVRRELFRQRFVVFAHTRSGSYHLVSLLNGHPEIRCHGEILQPVRPPFARHVSIIGEMEERFHDPDYRRDHYEEFLEAFYKTSRGRIGYKLIAGQHDPAMVYSIFDPSIRVVYLYRDNILAVYSSEQIAKATGQDRVSMDDEVIEAKAVFDGVEFERRCNARQARHALYLELLKRSGKPFIALEYQDVQKPEKQRELLRFLGASPSVQLKSMYQKRNSSDIVSRFANPDDVMAYLQESGHLDWAVEGPVASGSSE